MAKQNSSNGFKKFSLALLSVMGIVIIAVASILSFLQMDFIKGIFFICFLGFFVGMVKGNLPKVK